MFLKMSYTMVTYIVDLLITNIPYLKNMKAGVK